MRVRVEPPADRGRPILRRPVLELALEPERARLRGRGPVHSRPSTYAPRVRGAAPGGRRRRPSTSAWIRTSRDGEIAHSDRLSSGPRRSHMGRRPISRVREAQPARPRSRSAAAVVLAALVGAAPSLGRARRPARPRASRLRGRLGAQGVDRGQPGDRPGGLRAKRRRARSARPRTRSSTVTVAALDELGAALPDPDARATARAILDGNVWRGRLVLKGFGDPTLSRADLAGSRAGAPRRRDPASHRRGPRRRVLLRHAAARRPAGRRPTTRSSARRSRRSSSDRGKVNGAHGRRPGARGGLRRSGRRSSRPAIQRRRGETGRPWPPRTRRSS